MLLWILPVSSCLHQRRAWINTANACQTKFTSSIKKGFPKQTFMCQIIFFEVIQSPSSIGCGFSWQIDKLQYYIIPRRRWCYNPTLLSRSWLQDHIQHLPRAGILAMSWIAPTTKQLRAIVLLDVILVRLMTKPCRFSFCRFGISFWTNSLGSLTQSLQR